MWGPKVRLQMLIRDHSLTRAGSIGSWFTAWQDFSLTSLLLKGIISLHQTWNTLSETKLWTTLSHTTQRLLWTNEAASMLLVCHLTDCGLLSSRCVLHNVQENCLTWSEQLGAIWLLTSLETIDFYLISDELMFSECHYCKRVNITLRFTSNSLSSSHFILAD